MYVARHYSPIQKVEHPPCRSVHEPLSRPPRRGPLTGMALTACSAGGATEGDSAETLDVDGFSVMEAANEPVFADFKDRRRGRGRRVRHVVRRVRRPEPRRRLRRRRRRRPLLPRVRRDPPRRRGPGRRGLEGHPDTKGIATSSVVVFVVRKGNPEDIQDLGRPGQARRGDHHAQPGLVGLGALEHPRRLGARDPATAAREEEAT